MQLFLSTFNMVMPMFALVFVGWLVQHFGVLDEAFAPKINNFCFRTMIPCLMFRAGLNVTFDAQYLWMILFFGATVAISVPLLCVFAKHFIPDGRQAGAFVQTCFRTNTGIIGIGLMESVCGAENIAPMIIVVAFSTFFFNVAAISEMTWFTGESRGFSHTMKSVLRELVKSPMIIGTVLGLLAGLMPFEVPYIVMKPINDLAACTMPVAMISIGMRFSKASISGNRRVIAAATFIKMVLMPAVWTVAAYMVGFRSYVLCALYFEKASTTISIAPAIADAYGCDGKLTGEILVAQTAVACVTMFIGVYLLQALHIF